MTHRSPARACSSAGGRFTTIPRASSALRSSPAAHFAGPVEATGSEESITRATLRVAADERTRLAPAAAPLCIRNSRRFISPPWLKTQPRIELGHACALGIRETAERRIQHIAGKRAQVGVVKRVERVHADLKLHSLRYPKVFADREIGVPVAGTANRAAPQRARTNGQAGRLADRNRCKCSLIQVLQRLGVVIVDGRTNDVGTAGVFGGAFRDDQRHARSRGKNAGNLPVSERLPDQGVAQRLQGG